MGTNVGLGFFDQCIQCITGVVRLGFELVDFALHSAEFFGAGGFVALGPFEGSVGFLVLLVRHVIGGF